MKKYRLLGLALLFGLLLTITRNNDTYGMSYENYKSLPVTFYSEMSFTANNSSVVKNITSSGIKSYVALPTDSTKPAFLNNLTITPTGLYEFKKDDVIRLLLTVYTYERSSLSCPSSAQNFFDVMSCDIKFDSNVLADNTASNQNIVYTQYTMDINVRFNTDTNVSQSLPLKFSGGFLISYPIQFTTNSTNTFSAIFAIINLPGSSIYRLDPSKSSVEAINTQTEQQKEQFETEQQQREDDHNEAQGAQDEAKEVGTGEDETNQATENAANLFTTILNTPAGSCSIGPLNMYGFNMGSLNLCVYKPPEWLKTVMGAVVTIVMAGASIKAISRLLDIVSSGLL